MPQVLQILPPHPNCWAPLDAPNLFNSTVKLSIHCNEKYSRKQVAQLWKTQAQFGYKKAPESQDVWSSKALLQSEMMFLSADFILNKKADFQLPSPFCPGSVSVHKKQNGALFSLCLQEQRALYKKHLGPLPPNDKGTFSVRSQNILAFFPKPIMERWAALQTAALPQCCGLVAFYFDLFSREL